MADRAHVVVLPVSQWGPIAIFFALLAGTLGIGIIAGRRYATHSQQRAVEQVSWQFIERQLHAPLILTESRLRCEEPHRQRCGIGIG